MFKSEAKLFLSANNNINSAKTLINECKRLIVDFNLEGNSDCKNLKSNISNCNINALVTKVETTLDSLKQLDPEFATEYMIEWANLFSIPPFDPEVIGYGNENLYYIESILNLDPRTMDDIQKQHYNNFMREYNKDLLNMLEKYEESGMLTDEMKQQLLYQRELVAQYDIQDKMAVLDPTTDEYINLFKQCADYDRKLINLNPSLSEEEKASYLKEYNTQYNQNLDALINARDARLKREKDEKELEELYASKEDNNGLWHPFVESEIDEAILDKKIAMGIATEDEIAYKNMNGWDRFWTDTGTVAASTFTGLFNLIEGIGDSFVMLGSAVNIVDKEWASDYISRDISGELYQGIQLSTNMNSYSAYGTWHTAGEAFGGFVGKAGITFAAPWASAALYGLDAMGQSAETSFNNGDDYWAAFGKSFVSGIGGAAEGYGLAKLNLGIRNFASSGALKTLGGTAWSGIKTTLTSPGGLKVVGGNLWNLTKSGVKHIPSALGKAGLATLKDADALIETGCVLANNSIECAQSGNFDLKKMLTEAGAVFAVNYFMNFATRLVDDINSSSSKPKIQTNFGSQKMNMDDLSYRRVGPVSSSYYMLESNVRKYSYVDTSTINGLNDSIKQNGLYHFTDSCDEILDSGYIKSSGYIASYGNKKSFFFNGVPDVGAYATNLDSLPLRTTAVKIMPDDDILSSSSLKVRHLDDQAITYDGNFKFSEGKATKEYFILVKENDKLVYRNVSKEIFDNYPNTESGKLLNDLVSKKSNVNMIKNDYYYNMSIKDTNTAVTAVSSGKSYESIFESNSLVSSAELASTGTANLTSKLGFNNTKKFDNFKKYSLSDAEITGIGTSKRGLRVSDINPEIMENLQPNHLAVFGYNAKTGTWSLFDWTDYDKVMVNRRCREIYLELDDELAKVSASRIEAGENLEDIARDAVEKRNQNKLDARIDMNFEDRTKVELRNVAKYSPGLSDSQRKMLDGMAESIYKESENALKVMVGDNITEEMLHRKAMELMSEKIGISIEDAYKSSVGPTFEQLVENKIKKLKKSGVSSPSMEQIYMELISDSARANEELNVLLGLIQGGKK